MAKLTPEEKASRARERKLETARKYQIGTYARKYVAPIFQQMVRAEDAAQPAGTTYAIFDYELGTPFRALGQCVCVTCGAVHPWKGGLNRFSGMHTGHFLASRRTSILFEEDNVAPQCSHCNYQRGGEQQLFRKWMLAVRGPEVVERLERLKNTVRQFTREELVDMKIAYSARLRAAEELMRDS